MTREKMPISGCDGCVDWVKCGPRWLCNFALNNGKARSTICRPGRYCTVKSTVPRGPGGFTAKRRRTSRIKWDEEKALEAHRNGASDPEIAAAAGATTAAIWEWRKRRGLKANRKQGWAGGNAACK